MRLRRYAGALEASQQLLHVAPHDEVAQANAALCLRLLGRGAEAAELARQITDEHPAYEGGWYELALALDDCAAHDDALVAAERLLAIDPADRDVAEVRARALIHLERWDDAEGALERLLGRTVASDGDRARWWRLRVLLELERERYADALEAAQAASQIGGDFWQNAALRAVAAVGALGFGAGLEVLRSSLDSPRAEGEAAEAATRMLAIEAKLRGPQALGRAVEELMPVLEEHGQQDAMADVLAELLRQLLTDPELEAAPWSGALSRIAAAVAEIPQCRTPLEMLSAGIRFRKSGDRVVLLELPLEQRAIVEEALGLDTP